MTLRMSASEARQALRIVIDLPWPHKDLSPNASVNRFVRAGHVKKHRRWALWVARPHGPVSALELAVTLIFSPPGNYHYDDDNLISRCKSYLDGIADGLGVNDNIFRIQAPKRARKVKHGNVRFEIEVKTDGAD